MSSFEQMRADLVSRGLLASVCGDFRLTEAGHAHVDAMKAELRETEAPYDPDGPRVRWQYAWRVGK